MRKYAFLLLAPALLTVGCATRYKVAVKCNLIYFQDGSEVSDQGVKSALFVLDYAKQQVTAFDGDHLTLMVDSSFGEKTVKFSFPDYRNPAVSSPDLPVLLLDRQTLKIEGKMYFRDVKVSGICHEVDLPDTTTQGKRI